MRLTEILQNITEAFVAHVIGEPAANTIIVPTAVKRKKLFRRCFVFAVIWIRIKE